MTSMNLPAIEARAVAALPERLRGTAPSLDPVTWPRGSA